MMKHAYVILFFLASAAHSEDAGCGKILSLQGQVEVLRQKEDNKEVRIGLKAEDKMKIECTDIIVTGRASRAKIKLQSTLITVAPTSRFSIQEFDSKSHEPSLLNLTYGKIRSLVKKKADASEKSLTVTTPSAVMGVRGTDFYASFDPNTRLTQQATLEGKVETQQKGSEQKVMVEPGMQVSIEEPPASDDTNKKPVVKALKVEPITNKVIEQIKQTSYIAKDDKEFTSAESIAILGSPDKWQPSEEELPMDLKDIKNEF